MKLISLAVAVLLVMPSFLISPAHAMVGDIYLREDSVEFEVCFPKQSRGARGFLELTDGSGNWRKAEDDFSVMEVVLNADGCARENLSPAQYANPDESEVAYRVRVPKQKRNGRTIPAQSKFLDNYRVWHIPDFNRVSPVPHLSAFGSKFGYPVATVICRNPWGGGGQGSGFAVRVNNPDPSLPTFLVTAGHVNRECNYSNYRDVTVIYQGVSYPGRSWSSTRDPDVGTVITSAPIQPAVLAGGPSNRPSVGDAGISVGVAGGIVGTTTQGQIVGVSDKELNTTIPSGPGASGAPVFNNKGEVIGLIVAGSGSLTVATSLPTFCGGVFISDPCSVRW